MSKYLPLLLIIILSWIAIRPLTGNGFFPIHDNAQVARVYEIAHALKDGQFPVRWVSDLGYGYGYPLFNFYAPLPYYVGGAFYLIGFDPLSATKLMFIVGIVLSGICMYLFTANVFNNTWVGILSAVLYLYAPYHAVDIYVRGAVGEFWALGFLPLLILGIYKIITACQSRENKKEMVNGIIITSFSFAAIMLSHNITGMLATLGFIFFLLLYLARVILNKINIFTFCILNSAFLIGLGLAAFFWLPALTESLYTSVSTLTSGGSDFHNHFVFLDQLWASPWGYGGSSTGRLDGISFMVGKIHIILSSLGILLILFVRSIKRQYAILVLSICLIFILSIYLTTKYSLKIWESLPFLAFVQYPWRLLIFATFSLSILASVPLLAERKLQFWLSLVLSLMVIVYNGRYFIPKEMNTNSYTRYINQNTLQWEISKTSDEYLPSNFIRPKSIDQIRDGKSILPESIFVQREKRKSNNINFTAISDQDQVVTANLTYFPGWRVYRNGKQLPLLDKDGKIAFLIKAGNSNYQIKLLNTGIRTFSNLLSLLSLFILSGLYYGAKKKVY